MYILTLFIQEDGFEAGHLSTIVGFARYHLVKYHLVKYHLAK